MFLRVSLVPNKSVGGNVFVKINKTEGDLIKQNNLTKDM